MPRTSSLRWKMPASGSVICQRPDHPATRTGRMFPGPVFCVEREAAVDVWRVLPAAPDPLPGPAFTRNACCSVFDGLARSSDADLFACDRVEVHVQTVLVTQERQAAGPCPTGSVRQRLQGFRGRCFAPTTNLLRSNLRKPAGRFHCVDPCPRNRSLPRDRALPRIPRRSGPGGGLQPRPCSRGAAHGNARRDTDRGCLVTGIATTRVTDRGGMD